MSAENPVNHQPVPYRDDDEIDLLDLLIVFAKNKFFILGAALLFALAAVGVTSFMSPIYRATGSFLVLPAKTTAQQSINQKTAADLAKSDQVIGDAALRLNLAETWREPEGAKLIAKIRNGLSIQSQTVTMEGNDPKSAAAIVNAVIEETGKQILLLHEKQLQTAGAALTLMEKEINAARKELSSAIRAFFETVEEYNISRDEKNALFDHQQFVYETDSKVAAILPDGGAAYFETLRSLKTRETFYFSLISQYSKVLEQENTEPVTLHILEKASVPAHPIKPRKTLIVMMSGFLGGFIGIFGGFIREFARNAKKDPERKAKLEELSAAMRIFRKKERQG